MCSNNNIINNINIININNIINNNNNEMIILMCYY